MKLSYMLKLENGEKDISELFVTTPKIQLAFLFQVIHLVNLFS